MKASTPFLGITRRVLLPKAGVGSFPEDPVVARYYGSSPAPLRLDIKGEELVGTAAAAGADQSLTLGFYSHVFADSSPTFVCYFAPSRSNSSVAPSYESGLAFVVGNQVISTDAGEVTLVFTKGLFSRSISFLRENRCVAHLKYPWAPTRQWFSRLVGDPSIYVSNDFVEEAFGVAVCYGSGEGGLAT